eukprot:6175996-Pleurochrysis_carterae.AAC.2
MLSIDSAHAERYFVPLDLARGRLERERDTDEMTADATEVARDHIQIAPNEFGQFCNDLAFDADLLSRHDAAWRYAEASQRNNLLQLVWQSFAGAHMAGMHGHMSLQQSQVTHALTKEDSASHVAARSLVVETSDGRSRV